MTLTLEDIGRMAGVSRSTVSRVINGDDNVRPEVRQRVHDVVRRTGYAPNAAARSLASSRTGVIGLVIPSRVHDLFEDPYFARLIQGISTASNAAGITLSLFLFQSEHEERELYPRVVESGFIDGLIITATRMGDPLLAHLLDSGMPLVVVGRPDTDGVSYVDVDNVGGGRAVASHLWDLGHRRIALLAAPSNTTAGLDRSQGFVDGLADAGGVLDPALRVEGDFSEASGYRGMQRLLPLHPEAVFVASDTMARGALRALREQGLDVPADIAVVGFDDISRGMAETWLTTVRQPVADSGGHAVRLLNELIRNKDAVARSEIMPVELVVRGSSDPSRTRRGSGSGTVVPAGRTARSPRDAQRPRTAHGPSPSDQATNDDSPVTTTRPGNRGTPT
jgi:LacI family transcriptional regulator